MSRGLERGRSLDVVLTLRISSCNIRSYFFDSFREKKYIELNSKKIQNWKDGRRRSSLSLFLFSLRNSIFCGSYLSAVSGNR
jgi:hypothetical protein